MVKILITDDSELMRQSLKSMLAEAGYKNFLEADTGDKAINLYKKEKPDLVLLDIMLVGSINGITTLKEIKDIDEEAKVMIVSFFEYDNYVKEAKDLGAIDFISKPVNPKKLVKAVKAVLK